jgi:mitotic spindle assembly checkpoint protein MAD2
LASANLSKVTSDDQVKAYIKKIMSQLNKWMLGQKISKLVIVFTGKETGENVERWQFDVRYSSSPSISKLTVQVNINKTSKSKSSSKTADKENAGPENAPPTASSETVTDEQIQTQIRALFRQITASVTFLPELTEPCTFNVLVYADADSEVPIEWGDSDAKEIDGGEKVQLRSFSTSNHRVDTLVSYRMGD